MYQDLHSIVNDLAKHKVIEHISKKFVNRSPYIEDLCQDLYIDLLNKDEDFIVGMYEKNLLGFYIYKMLANNINSSTSSFYKKYQKYRKMTDEINDQD